MNQQELEALLAQIAPNNDPRRLEFSEGTETVEVEEQAGPYVAPTKVKRPVRTMTWVDRGTGQTLIVQANPDGTYTKKSQGIDPKVQGEPSTTPAQVAKDEQGVPAGSRQETDAQGKTVKVTTYKRPDGTTYEITESVQAAPEKPQVAPGTLNTTSPQYAVVNPDGSITWRPNPNYKNPTPKPLDIPNTRTIIWDNGDGTTKTEKNPAYVKPSKLIPHPSDPTKMVNVTEDDDGKPIILPVNDKTVIKPADLPVLQTKYGEISTGLGALAQDLNGKYARGEITNEQRKEAWTAGYQQAQTQVSEINSILSNSQAIWSGQVTQRGQSLAETQSRRGYAAGIFDRAAATGMGIATSAGPGHGKEIAAGVGALMNIGQQYAQGMGGFRESPEVALPPALQQAQGIGIPGYPMPGSPGSPGISPGISPGSPSSPSGGIGPPTGISDTTDRGGLPREFTPSSASGPPGLSPVAQLIGGQLQAGLGSAGAPVAAGGSGLWDPNTEAEGMIGDGKNPGWAEAVRAAAAGMQQGGGGYAWDRFRQPASRFGV